MYLKGAWAIHCLCEVAQIMVDPTDIPQTELGLFRESAARRSATQYDSARRGRAGGKRRREDDDEGNDDDDEDKDETPGVETSGHEKAAYRVASVAPVARGDVAGTSAAPEASHVRSRPRVPTASTPMTL